MDLTDDRIVRLTEMIQREQDSEKLVALTRELIKIIDARKVSEGTKDPSRCPSCQDAPDR